MRPIYKPINQDFMRIVLLGYMGSGKSTVGKELAQALDIPFTDLDDRIIEKENKSIKEIFASKGEIYFRLQEGKYLEEWLESNDEGILSLGGGTPCYGDNMAKVKKASISIYLKGSIATICQRLRNEKNERPLIASLNDEQLTEYIAKHLFERRDFYEQASHTINIDHKSVSDIAKELGQLVNSDHSKKA